MSAPIAPHAAPLAPCPAPFNLAAYVLGQAAVVPDKTALAIVGPVRARRWRYRDLNRAVLGVAGALGARGLPGDSRILLRLGNTVDFPIAFLGAIAAGHIPVPTAAGLSPPEITRIAADLNPALIIADPDLALPDGTDCPVIESATLEQWFSAPPAAPVLGDPNRAAYIVYTSGTSGRARGVVHAHRAVWARRSMWAGWYGLREDDRLMHAGAFNWTFTLGTGLLDPWAIGATALIPEPGTQPGDLPLLMRRYDATIFAAAPGVYRQMLKRVPTLTLPRLRHGLSAGEKLSDDLRAAWETATGTRVHEALGMSECSTYLSASPERPAPAGTSGYVQPGRQVAVLDESGHPVAPGASGELAIGAGEPGLMLGYWNGATGAPDPLPGAWFRTGDMVAPQADGAIRYLGRNDDMLNAGGFRVSPLEVEAAFAHHPAIDEAAAIALEIKPGAWVIALVCAGRETDDDTLHAHARTRLARYKQPRLYLWRDALARGANGKLNRRQIAQESQSDVDKT